MAARFAMAAVRLSPSGSPGPNADEQLQLQQYGDGAAAPSRGHPAIAAASAAAAGLAPPVAALLQHGGLLTAYITDGSNSYFTRVLSLFPELSGGPPGAAPGAVTATLYWCEAGRRELRPSRAIPLSSLRCILVGKHTRVLQWSAISADPERCFSLQWDDECIDLECDTEAQRAHWLALIDHLLTEDGRRVIEQPERGADAEGAELDGGPIDPLSFLTRRSASMGDAAAFASGLASVAAASTGAVATAAAPNACGSRRPARVQLPSPDRFFAHIGSAVDLDFSTQKHKRFVVLDPSPACDDPSSPAATTLADTLQQFQQWIDATPLQPPSVPPLPDPADSAGSTPARASLRTDTRAPPGLLGVPPSAKSLPPTPSHRRQGSSATPVAPKDDPRSLEGSLSRLGAGVFFQYCAPPSEVDPSAPALARLASTILAAARSDGAASPSSPVSLPGEVPPALSRPQSLSEVMTSIVLFYAPHARRVTERSGRNFGQLSWCDSQVWTRKAAWKLPLHVDSVILLGKRSANLQRPVYAYLAESSCFSIVNGEGAFGHGVDLCAEGGWPAIRAWLHDVDRILRSGGYALARAGGMASPASPASAFNSPSVGSSNGSLKTLPLLAAPLGLCTRLVFVSQADLAKSASAQVDRVRPPSVGLLQLGQGPPLGVPAAGSGAGGGVVSGHRCESSKAPQLFTFPSVNSSTMTHSMFSATASMVSSTVMDASASGGSSTWAGGLSLAAPSAASAASLHVRAGCGGCPSTAEPSPSHRSALRRGPHNRRQNSHPLPPLDHLASGQPYTPTTTSPAQPLPSGLGPPGSFALPLAASTNGQQTPTQTQPPTRTGHARGLSVTLHGAPARSQTPPVLAIDPHAPVDENASARALSPPVVHSFVTGSPRSRPPLSADSPAAPASAHRRVPSRGINLLPLQSQTSSAPQQQPQQQQAQAKQQPEHQSSPASASPPRVDSCASAVDLASPPPPPPPPLSRDLSVSRSLHMLSMSTAPRSPSQPPLTSRLQHLQML